MVRNRRLDILYANRLGQALYSSVFDDPIQGVGGQMLGGEEDQSGPAALADQIDRPPRILFLNLADFFGELVRLAL